MLRAPITHPKGKQSIWMGKAVLSVKWVRTARDQGPRSNLLKPLARIVQPPYMRLSQLDLPRTRSGRSAAW